MKCIQFNANLIWDEYNINIEKINLILFLIWYIIKMLIKYNNDEEVENRLLTLFEFLSEWEKQTHLISILELIINFKWAPIPPNAKPLKTVDLFEIRIKFWKELCR